VYSGTTACPISIQRRSVHRKRPFRGLSIAQKRKLIHDVNEIVQRHTTWGFSASLHKKDYDEHYIAGHRPGKIQLDTMYGVCLRMCLSFAIEMTQTVVAWENPKIKFVLEACHKNAADATRIFEQVRKGVPELRDVLDTIVFVEKDAAYGVQRADAVAYAANLLERGGDLELTDFGPGADIYAAKRKVRAKAPAGRPRRDSAENALK